MMIRTQILLPQEMLWDLRAQAREEKSSVSHIIRKTIQKKSKKNKKKMTGYEFLRWLADNAFEGKNLPKDFATNDKYLYSLP